MQQAAFIARCPYELGDVVEKTGIKTVHKNDRQRAAE